MIDTTDGEESKNAEMKKVKDSDDDENSYGDENDDSDEGAAAGTVKLSEMTKE